MGAPHDESFFAAFQDPRRARELLRLALPAEVAGRLDLDSLEVVKGSYVGPDLRSSASDLLLTTRTSGVDPVLLYVLFEHKSSPDGRTLFQLLSYMVSIWERWTSRAENKGWRQLPPIVPVVFSHARRRWTAPMGLSALVQKPPGMDLDAYVHSFSALLRLLKYVPGGKLGDVIPALSEMERAGAEAGLAGAALTYVLRGRRGESVAAILEATQGGEMRKQALSAAEQLEKRGREEGRLEEMRSRLERQLERKFGLTEEERTLLRSAHDAARLDAALDEILFADSQDAVLAHLR